MNAAELRAIRGTAQELICLLTPLLVIWLAAFIYLWFGAHT